MRSVYLGLKPFDEVRRLQEELVFERQTNKIEDTLLFCEHPPTLSLGRRTKDSDFPAGFDRFQQLGAKIVKVDRGGGPTYHGPGQLLFYPVISLRARQIGVRKLVTLGLDSVCKTLENYSISCSYSLSPAGVWTSKGSSNIAKKIAACGLRIIGGVSNHGFAINLGEDVSPFSWFSACGVEGSSVTSAYWELERKDLDQKTFASHLAVAFEEQFPTIKLC